MKRNNKLLESGPISKTVTTRADFEFSTGALTELPNHVVFFGKVITRKTEPKTRTENVVVPGIRSSSGKETRYRRSGSEKKRYTGMFGMVKFPLQMELSDIKMRQERREPVPLPKFTTKEDGGGESCWEMVRPLRRRGTVMSALKASFGCIHFV
ncbi:unnamed protein product [Lathyrus oleraceus]